MLRYSNTATHKFFSLIYLRLTYKYHRLVTSSDRPGELPQVEKCVVDDDEEDDEEVRQLFASNTACFLLLMLSNRFR